MKIQKLFQKNLIFYLYKVHLQLLHSLQLLEPQNPKNLSIATGNPKVCGIITTLVLFEKTFLKESKEILPSL